MNREEVLAKSRKENIDEGMIEAENKGRKMGFCVFCIVFAFIVIFNFFNGQPTNYAAKTMFWAFLAVEAFPKYAFTKQKAYLIITIAGSIAAIASLGSFIITVLR